MWIKRYLSLLSLLCSLQIQTKAVENSAFLNFTQWDTDFTHRQSVCDRQNAYLKNENGVTLGNALKGMNLSILAFNDGIFFSANNFAKIGYPGFFSEILDEVARRGEFSWRDSIGVLDQIDDDKTFTDLVLWGVDKFDLFVARVTHSSERISKGMYFTRSIADATLVYIMNDGTKHKNGIRTKSFYDDFSRTFLPFDEWLWGCVLLTILLSAIVLAVIESTRLNLQDFGSKSFLSALVFLQHANYAPKTQGGKVLVASLAFWSLVIMSFYTANYASFLVIERTKPDKGRPTIKKACVFKGSEELMLTKTRFAQDKDLENVEFVEKETWYGNFEGLLLGECDIAVNTAVIWDYVKNNKDIAGLSKFDTCNLTQVELFDTPEPTRKAGFAVKMDNQNRCTRFVGDVINLHLSEMEWDGTLDTYWKTFLARSKRSRCSRPQTETSGEDVRIDMNRLMGPFVIHATFTCIAIFLTILSKTFWQKRQKKGDYDKLNHLTSDEKDVARDASLNEMLSELSSELAIFDSRNLPPKNIQHIGDDSLAPTLTRNYRQNDSGYSYFSLGKKTNSGGIVC